MAGSNTQLLVGGAIVVALVAAAVLSGAAAGAWTTKYASTRKRMTPTQVRFMDNLRQQVPAHIPLVVTSARRTPAEQGAALRAKLKAGATLADLRKLYGYSEAIEELVRHPPEVWDGVLAGQVARGVYLSGHMRDDGLDLSTREVPRSWQDTIVAAAKRCGAERAFVEASPAHIHVEV